MIETQTLTIPEAGREYFGLSRNAAYAAAKCGEHPYNTDRQAFARSRSCARANVECNDEDGSLIRKMKKLSLSHGSDIGRSRGGTLAMKIEGQTAYGGDHQGRVLVSHARQLLEP
jgi:hypothetical protein